MRRIVGDAAGRDQCSKHPLIWSEVAYNYKPTIGYVITGTLNLSDQIWMRPRLSETVTRVNS